MQWWTLLLCLILFILAGAYWYIKSQHNYWSRRGINGPKPVFFFGNIFDLLHKGLTTTEIDWLKQFGKVYGCYIGLTPALTIADAELIKQVLVRDFALFINRRQTKFDHEIWSKNLFLSEDDTWKKIRSITSPTFTSGKLRKMNLLMSQCVDKLVAYFSSVVENGDGVMELKEAISGFTIDVIASTNFATEVNTNSTGGKMSPLVQHGLQMFRGHPLKLLSLFSMPKCFNNFLNLRHPFPEESFDFFRDLVKSIVKQRRKANRNSGSPKRNDLVQLLIDAYVYESELHSKGYEGLAASMEKDESREALSNGTSAAMKKTLDDNEIFANCLIYFVAGFETTASTITHCLYELAINGDVQERLKEEINLKLNGVEPESERYFEVVTTQIHYLDAVIKECLRKYPPVTRIERRLNADNYKLAGIRLEREQLVQISTYAVHHSPEYYPEPGRFNPERFMPGKRVIPYTYLPFGQGPRNCVGMRFAYQEIKLCLAKIVPQFRFSTTPETPIPLQFATNSLLLSVNSLPIKVEKR